MHKLILSFTTLLALASYTAAQSAIPTPQLFPIIVNHKSGFINVRGKVVIKPKFDEVKDFSDGLALVQIGSRKILRRGRKPRYITGLWGYIDTRGKFVIPPKFADAASFSEGLAGVWLATRHGYFYGYVDKKGRIAIKPRFRMSNEFRGGLARVSIGDSYAARFIDRTDKIISSAAYDALGDFTDGLAVIGHHQADGSHLVGFIDRSWNIIIPPKFPGGSDFKEGLAMVGTGVRENGLQKNGFISTAAEGRQSTRSFLLPTAFPKVWQPSE